MNHVFAVLDNTKINMKKQWQVISIKRSTRYIFEINASLVLVFTIQQTLPNVI